MKEARVAARVRTPSPSLPPHCHASLHCRRSSFVLTIPSPDGFPTVAGGTRMHPSVVDQDHVADRDVGPQGRP